MRVFSNTAMSADGKIGVERTQHASFGSAEDRRMMSELRAQADAVLVGGQTFRCWPLPMIEKPAHLRYPRTRDRPIVNAVLTARGVLDARPRPDAWPDLRAELLILGREGIDEAAHRARFPAELRTHPEPSVAWALDVLAERGCRSVLIEGGGDLIFRTLEADRLDELFLTVCPLVIGGTRAPTPADGPGFDADDLRRLRLLEARHVGDEVYLHYAVGPRNGC